MERSNGVQPMMKKISVGALLRPDSSYVHCMKTGDLVKHKLKPEYGIGKIVSFYVSQGTAMVRFENLKDTTYHILWTLEKHEDR